MMKLIHGDCLEVMRTKPDNSVDAIVTDPPYGLSFMGKKWDYDVPSVEIWQECLRVLKPGGHLLAFAGTRTHHRMAVNIEDAGFEVRDMIGWMHGSGFPKSMDVSKAIDKATGAEREKVLIPTKSGNTSTRSVSATDMQSGFRDISEPVTGEAKQWQGWGTALKPAFEPITVARKPLIDTVANNVLRYGTGGLNIDGCRIPTDSDDPVHSAMYHAKPSVAYGKFASKENLDVRSMAPPEAGRFPANLIHDGSEEVLKAFPDNQFRFFYCAKASRKDRDDGLDGFEAKNNMRVNAPRENEKAKHQTLRKNNHPTVKPIDLMRYLCRLVTPPGGIVLDPFMGSGSTGKAAILERFLFIGIERDKEYYDIACARLAHLTNTNNCATRENPQE